MNRFFSIFGFLFFAQLSVAAPHPCQSSVEAQEPVLSKKAFARLESDKNHVVTGLTEASELSDPEKFKIVRLILDEKNVVFNFGNEEGVWVSIVNAKDCKVVMTKQTYIF